MKEREKDPNRVCVKEERKILNKVRGKIKVRRNVSEEGWVDGRERGNVGKLNKREAEKR